MKQDNIAQIRCATKINFKVIKTCINRYLNSCEVCYKISCAVESMECALHNTI